MKKKLFPVSLVLVIGICSFFLYSSLFVRIGEDIVLKSRIDEVLKEKRSLTDDEEINRAIDCRYSIKKAFGPDKVSFCLKSDEEAIHNIIEKRNLSGTDSIDAKIVNKDGKFSIEKEIYGTKLSADRLIEDIKAKKTDIKVKDYIKRPVYTTNDLDPVLSDIKTFKDWHITYTNKNTLSVPDSAFSINGKSLTVDEDFIEEEIKDLLSSYETRGAVRTIKNPKTGKDTTVSGGTWGSDIDYEKEVFYARSLFEKAKSEEGRTPFYKKEMPDDFSDCIYIDKSAQMLYLVKDNATIFQTPVVTGSVKAGHDTPEGIYFISEKLKNHVMKGDGYSTLAHQWLRLTNTGIGIHDAYWRSNFGGDIYKTSGSHGCINVPKENMETLFNMNEISVGLPVIIK